LGILEEWLETIQAIVAEQQIDLIIPCTAPVESSAYSHLWKSTSTADRISMESFFFQGFLLLVRFLGLDDFAQSKFAFWGFATVLKGRATATLEHDPLFLTKCSASVADFECAL
jgi:hypothetical protein